MSDPASDSHWEWDETLFAGAAAYYVRGRTPYAPGLATALRDAVGLDPARPGRLLDVGSGPGTVALRVAHLFAEVVALDADAGMLAEGARLAAERRITTVRWIRMLAEDLPGALGMFRVATLAASFHWFDRPRVAGALRRMLDPDGAAVQVDAPSYRPHEDGPDPRLPHPPPPWSAIDALRVDHLGPHRRAGRGVRDSSPDGEDAVFRAAGFAPGVRHVVPDRRHLVRDADDLVALVLSTSSSAPHLFGDRLGEFESDLRAVLTAASPSGRFSVVLPNNVLTVWRPT